MAVIDDPIGFVLDCDLLLFAETPVMSDIKMSLLSGFLCTILPDMRSEHLSASGEDDMCACVMGLELLAALLIDRDMGDFALYVFSGR